MKIMNLSTYLKIDRNKIFFDAFDVIMALPPQKLKNKPVIAYKREEGIDAGGLLK